MKRNVALARGVDGPGRRPRGLRPGRTEVAALAVSALCVGLAVTVVGLLHLASAEAAARTAHLALLFDGPARSPLTVGVERPPVLSVLGLPLAAIPPLRAHGLAAALGTAAVGGLGVLAAHRLARWAGIGRAGTAIYAAAFALHPLLLLSAATGLPEALYACVLLIGFGQFARWLDAEATAPVVNAGVSLGAAFLLRYNSLWITVVMMWMFWWVAKNRGSAIEGPDRAQATVVAFAAPVLFMAGLWAVGCSFLSGAPADFVSAAAHLTRLADDPDVLRRMATLRGNVPGVTAWILIWGALLAAPSLIAILALLLHGVARRARASIALAAALSAIALPEATALFSGRGQAHVPHLFALIVPAFVVLAYFARRATRHEAEAASVVQRRGQQRLAGVALLLLLASLGTAAVLPWLPASDPPARSLLRHAIDRAPASAPADVAAVARWINEHAAQGDVIADPERAAALILESGRFDRFRTVGSKDGQALIYDPYGVATYMLTRRRPAGAVPDDVEQAHPGLFADGAPYVSLAFAAGDYRVYRVDSAR